MPAAPAVHRSLVLAWKATSKLVPSAVRLGLVPLRMPSFQSVVPALPVVQRSVVFAWNAMSTTGGLVVGPDDPRPTGEMNPLMCIPMTRGSLPTVPGYAGWFRIVCEWLANTDSTLLLPPLQSPLTVSMVPSPFTCVTSATWSATPPPA